MRDRERWLIVNADDFGISRGVNRGIVHAYRHGLVTSASLMPNLPSSEDALTRAAGCPDLQLGLHLTLTAGRPVSPPERVPTLVDADGRFFVLGQLLARLSLGRVRRQDLERELQAQVAWALERGVGLDHLDSHHHVHIHPMVADVVLGLAVQHRMPYVRCPAEGAGLAGPPPASLRDAARALAISLFAQILRGRLRRRGRARGRRAPPLWTTDHFRGIALGFGFAAPALRDTLRRLPPGLTELMTHPGYPDDELAAVTDFVAGRDRELAALTSPEIRALVQAAGIRLTTFADAGNLHPRDRGPGSSSASASPTP